MYIGLSRKQQSRYLYRIISLERLFQLFRSGKNALVHPSKWDDPYENLILKSKVRDRLGNIKQYTYHNDIYGQCWTLNTASDAMWRIYSPEANGVRIRARVDRLFESFYRSGVPSPDRFCVIGKVSYLREAELIDFANRMYDNGRLKKDFLFRSLLLKRRAFRHEKEVRLLYFDGTDHYDGQSVPYDVNPHLLIDQIMIDPRMSFEDFKNLKLKIRRTTRYQGKIRRSLLYTPPELIISENAV